MSPNNRPVYEHPDIYLYKELTEYTSDLFGPGILLTHTKNSIRNINMLIHPCSNIDIPFSTIVSAGFSNDWFNSTDYRVELQIMYPKSWNIVNHTSIGPNISKLIAYLLSLIRYQYKLSDKDVINDGTTYSVNGFNTENDGGYAPLQTGVIHGIIFRTKEFCGIPVAHQLVTDKGTVRFYSVLLLSEEEKTRYTNFIQKAQDVRFRTRSFVNLLNNSTWVKTILAK
jgi:hypothetical protein